MKLRTGLSNGARATQRFASVSGQFISRRALSFWHLLMRNRLAIVIASLLWLIFRSGSQPRRLSYPCQQVAAFNVGAFVAGLVPALFLSRKPRCARAVPRAVMVRKQLLAAVCLLLAAFFCVEGYQYAAYTLFPYQWPDQAAPLGDPPQTVVGIARRDMTLEGALTEAEVEALVRKAIERAGGLEPLMQDKTSHDGVNPPDGAIRVVLKPNLVTTGWDGTQGVVADVRVCAAVAKVAYEAGADYVTIAEGTATGDGRDSTETAYVHAGFDGTDGPANQVFDYTFPGHPDVPLVDLNDTGGTDYYPPLNCRLVTLPSSVAVLRDDSNPDAFEGYWVHEAVLDADVFISVPTFKNHANGTVTLSLKNVGVGINPSDIYHNLAGDGWGGTDTGKLSLNHYCDHGFPCLVPPTPGHEHEVVQRSIVDVNLARSIDFAVVDGLIGVINGPNNTPVENPTPLMQMIVAGSDALAVDAVCTLAMTYDPDQVPHLNMAGNTGQLGTKDRSVVSVLGDRMWKVRSDDFEANYGAPYGGSVLVETDPPTILNISTTEGEVVYGNDVITASGISDTVGVVRAELGIDRLGDNLLANGDFETGDATGWTQWTECYPDPPGSGWGHDEYWEYDNTESGHLGNYCLRLGNSSTESSFGVFQEVTVEPGKTYRLDMYWRGEKRGSANWWEVILIDGPFTIQQADEGAYVEKNYMYAYDDVTYGFPGGVGETFGWVWGHNQYAPPVDQVDWNERQGRRTATGTTMTVVLKAGATGGSGVAAWFDEVTLREVVSEHIVDIVSNPTSPCDLTVNASQLPTSGPDGYDAELRVNVFDAALNEDGIYRNVTVNTVPPNPVVCVSETLLEHTIFVGDSLSDDTFGVWNCGIDVLSYDITDDDGLRVDVDPTGGVSSGLPANDHTISYSTSTLPPGTHVATITVTGPNNERTIQVTVNVETVPPDYDLDGDVDQSDFGHLQACLNTPGIPVTDPDCMDCDLDGDDGCDGRDVGILQDCMSGASVPPDPDCMP